MSTLTKLLAQCSRDLRNEIDYRREVFEESVDGHNEGDVFTIANAFREIAEDSNEPDHCAAKMRREILQILVEVGCYVPISESDAKDAVRCGLGVKLRDFPKLNNQRYEFVGWEPLSKF